MRKNKRLSKHSDLLLLFLKNPIGIGFFIIGAVAGYFSFEPLNPQWQSSNGLERLNVCFTPGGKCTDLIVREIKKAKSSLKVQAYSFTSKPIANAIIDMAKKGVKVELLVDKSLLSSPHSVLPLFKANRISFKVDHVPGIAHNKVIVIDDEAIISGSFNFTNAAQERNAENVLLIRDPELAKHYVQNWKRRLNN